MPLGPVELAIEVAELLDDLSIPYVLGGSVASSLVGEPRATMDVDLAVRLQREQVDALVAALGSAYSVSLDAAVDAVARASSFHLIHLDSMQKGERVVVAEDPGASYGSVPRRTKSCASSPGSVLAARSRSGGGVTSSRS